MFVVFSPLAFPLPVLFKSLVITVIIRVPDGVFFRDLALGIGLGI
jgi:hypothetical protein